MSSLDYATLCRRATLAACDASTSEAFANGALLTVRKGDLIDFGIIWAQFLTASRAKIKTAGSAWAAHGSSPQAPTITSPQLDIAAGETSFLLDATAATVGHEYWIENTVTMVPNTDLNPAPPAFADRTVKRTLRIKVV
jgi:hypothetical protein